MDETNVAKGMMALTLRIGLLWSKLRNRIGGGTKNNTLMKELVVCFTLVSAFVLIVLLFWFFTATLDIMENRQRDTTLRQFRQLEYNYTEFVNTIDTISKMSVFDLSNFMSGPKVDSQITSFEKYEQVEEITSEFMNILMNHSYIESVFLYMNNGAVYGRSPTLSKYLVDTDKQQFLYTSGLYDQACAAYPGMLWLGAGLTEERGAYHPLELRPGDQTERRIISAVRNVKNIYQDQISGVLVININQNKLAEGFVGMVDPGESEVCIADARGIVISDRNTERLGSLSTAFDAGRMTADYGSYAYKKGDLGYNVVYYKIKSTGWTIIEEIPKDIYVKDVTSLTYIAVFVFFLSFALIFLFSFALIKRITRPLNVLAEAMLSVSRGQLGATAQTIPCNNEFAILTRQFNQMSADIVLNIEKSERAQRERLQFEQAVLRAHLNPHFIYNTLNMIKWMAVLANSRPIADCLSVFADIIRPIYYSADEFWPLDEEYAYIANYIKIANYRHGGLITLTVDPAVQTHCQVPRFILQPILENCVSYGLREEGRPLLITIEEEVLPDQTMLIHVSDDGNGMEEEDLKRIRQQIDCDDQTEPPRDHSIGLKNTHQRLSLYYGKGFGLTIESRLGRGTRVNVHIVLEKSI